LNKKNDTRDRLGANGIVNKGKSMERYRGRYNKSTIVTGEATGPNLELKLSPSSSNLYEQKWNHSPLNRH